MLHGQAHFCNSVLGSRCGVSVHVLKDTIVLRLAIWPLQPQIQCNILLVLETFRMFDCLGVAIILELELVLNAYV